MQNLTKFLTVFFLAAQGPLFAEAEEQATTESKIEGAKLEYVSRTLQRSRRGARAEIDAIQAAVAKLRVEKPIVYRKATLPAGDYALKVETDEGKNRCLVLFREVGEAKTPKGKASQPDEASGDQDPENGDGDDDVEDERHRDGGEDEALERKEEKSSGEKKGKPEGSGKRVKSSKKSPEKNRSGKTEDDHAASPRPEELRVPLVLSECEKSSDALVIELKALSKGTRFRITLRAGGTEARAALIRFDETSKE